MQVLSYEYCEIIKNMFFKEHLLFIILFQNFIWWKNSLDVFGYKIDIFHISCAIALFFFHKCFFFIVLKSEVQGYFVLVFKPKFLESITFARFIMSQSESTSRIITTSPSNCEKCEYEFCEYYAFLLFFFRSCLARHR